jgi:hypothetical protein
MINVNIEFDFVIKMSRKLTRFLTDSLDLIYTDRINLEESIEDGLESNWDQESYLFAREMMEITEGVELGFFYGENRDGLNLTAKHDDTNLEHLMAFCQKVLSDHRCKNEVDSIGFSVAFIPIYDNVEDFELKSYFITKGNVEEFNTQDWLSDKAKSFKLSKLIPDLNDPEVRAKDKALFKKFVDGLVEFDLDGALERNIKEEIEILSIMGINTAEDLAQESASSVFYCPKSLGYLCSNKIDGKVVSYYSIVTTEFVESESIEEAAKPVFDFAVYECNYGKPQDPSKMYYLGA